MIRWVLTIITCAILILFIAWYFFSLGVLVGFLKYGYDLRVICVESVDIFLVD